MRTPRPAIAASGLTAALLLSACTPVGRQATDGGAVKPQPDNDAALSTVDTRWGPLGPADRALIVSIRRSALWEIPVGREAQRRAARTATRRSLAEIARRHVRLDTLDRTVAARLNVPLPNQPTPDQQSWMSEIGGKSGNEYDRTAVARMRTEQGQTYALLGAVRGSTRNTLMRTFAEQAEPFLRGNLKLLESTGFVTGDTLPDPPRVTDAPPPPAQGRQASPAPPVTSVLGGGR